MQSADHVPAKYRTALFVLLLLASTLACGCATSWEQYVHNGFKVGPNYARPAVPVAEQWIDAGDKRVRTECDDLSAWWKVFGDPVLDNLICSAYQQNLTLRQAGFRVLEARAQLRMAAGNLFPQTQQMTGDYARSMLSEETANNPLRFGFADIRRSFDRWDYGFSLGWELDFWGRFRRAVESNAASLDASVEDYDDVLVTLLADVATDYSLLRAYQERLRYAKENVALQRTTLDIVEAGFKAGTVNKVDMLQARSTLNQTEAMVPALEIGLRQTGNQLCILLGVPPTELQENLGTGPIPAVPPEVAVGIPADLLRRRPDVRRAERQAAAQCAQIGVAEADIYPHLSLTGTLGHSAQEFGDLFRATAMNGTVGPSFQWNILNYGRICSNVCYQRAKFQELAAAYQSAVLSAAQDVENGLVTFLRAEQRVKAQAAAVNDSREAAKIALSQYEAGTTLFTQVTQLELTLVAQEDLLAQAQQEAVAGLIQVYRALGGGWQIRINGSSISDLPGREATVEAAEVIPTPSPQSAASPPEETP